VSYLLASTEIRRPNNLEEGNSTQFAQNRTLSGAVTRDYFGSNKRGWIFDYVNVSKADYDTIKAIYDSYLASGTAQTFSSTEANYPVTATTVHVDLARRRFSVGGTDYISDFSLILTEA
jgi:hypothetical protein